MMTISISTLQINYFFTTNLITHLLTSSLLCDIGWWLEPSIQRIDICHSNWSRTPGSSELPSSGFHSFQIIFGKQDHAKNCVLTSKHKKYIYNCSYTGAR